MSKVTIVANCCDFVPKEKSTVYIGVDKGSFFCLQEDIPMVYAIGDFDSVDENQYNALQKVTKLIQLPCEKNETDSEFAIRYAHEQGYDEIDVYGVCGGRQDHFMVIMNLLRYAQIDFRIIDKQNKIYTLNKGTHILKKESKYISFFACEKLTFTSSGVKYPLEKIEINPSDIYLVSNEIIENECSIMIDGKIIVVESDDQL